MPTLMLAEPYVGRLYVNMGGGRELSSKHVDIHSWQFTQSCDLIEVHSDNGFSRFDREYPRWSVNIQGEMRGSPQITERVDVNKPVAECSILELENAIFQKLKERDGESN